MNTDPELEPGGTQEVTQSDPPEWAQRIAERQEMIDQRLAQILETPKPQVDPSATYIPGTDIQTPAGWDDWTYEQQQAFTHTKQREQIIAQVTSQMAPIATGHLMNQVKTGLNEEESVIAEQILKEAMKANPGFVFDDSNAHALRMMAVGEAEMRRRTSGVKDGLTPAQTQESSLAEMRAEAVTKWGDKVGSAFSDEELKEIFQRVN